MVERREIPIDHLVLDTVQSREKPWTGDDEDRRLTASVADEGILQDLLVRPVGESSVNSDGNEAEYAIIAGSRRYHAATEAGHEMIPCKVVEADDVEAAWKSLAENTDRKDLSEQEISQQVKLIYECVRPREEQAVHNGESGGDERFETEREAVEHIADRLLGRRDRNAVRKVRNYLKTAELPPVVQSLFKSPDERSVREKTALENYGIDTSTKLGTGEGNSRTSKEIARLHEAVDGELDDAAVGSSDAVLEVVGRLNHGEMSEQEFCQTLREFRHEAVETIDDSASADEQRETFREALDETAEEVREEYEEVEPNRPFRKVDVFGPEQERHCRWHVQAMRNREADNHAQLVRELYQERLEKLADNQGWM